MALMRPAGEPFFEHFAVKQFADSDWFVSIGTGTCMRPSARHISCQHGCLEGCCIPAPLLCIPSVSTAILSFTRCLPPTTVKFANMSDSARSTNNGASCMVRSAIIKPGHEDDLKDVITASTGGRIPTSRLRHTSVKGSTLLAQGGYNDIWLVEVIAKIEDGEDLCAKFVLREPNDDSFLPFQLTNEVAWLSYVSKYTTIPVPKVYKYSASKGDAYIAMEYIKGKPLHEIWKDQSEEQKDILAHEIASIVIQLGETRLDKIGGLDVNGHLAATVEGPKLFKGRVGSIC